MGDEDLEIITKVVTCHTEGCENAETPVTVSVSAAHPSVICGPCGADITSTIEEPKESD